MKRSAVLEFLFGVLLVLSCLFGDTVRLRAEDYVVRAEDKLRVKVFQYPELSGDYTVSATGTVAIAPIGEIYVAGSSAKAIASQISDRFIKAGLSDKPGTTVEVIQSRPIYVTGDVQKPGEYTFRPGLTVLQAISLSGGWFRINDPGLIRMDRDAILIKGDMRALLRRYFHLVAQRARLNAELDEKADIDFPAEIKLRAKTDLTLADLLDEERSFLGINVGSLRAQIDSLEKTRTLYEREIESVSLQIKASKAESASVKKEFEQIKELFARGLAPISRQTNLERTQAQIEMTQQGLQTLILRARQNITQVEQRLFDLRSERRSRLNVDLQRTRLDLEDIAVKLETNQDLMVEARLSTPSLVSNSDDLIETRSLTVVRVENGKTITLDADENTELFPGDVLKVQRSPILSGVGIGKFRARSLISPTAAKE